MPNEAQLPPGGPVGNKSLLRRVRVLTMICLALSLAPAIFVAAIAPGYVTYSDAAFLLLIFSPLWVPLLAVLVLSWTNKQERALAIATAVGSGGIVLGVCFLAVVIFLIFRNGMSLGNMGIPVVFASGVLGIFGALRSSAKAARVALAKPDTGSDAGASAPTPGDDAPSATALRKRTRRRELGWLTLISLGLVGGIVPLALRSLIVKTLRVTSPEDSATGSLRTINIACVTYTSTYENVGYPPALDNLGPGNPATAERADLIDQVLASGIKRGYKFRYTTGPRVDGVIKAYTVNADPIQPGKTGVRHFFTDQTAVIRFDAEKPATANSPPLY